MPNQPDTWKLTLPELLQLANALFERDDVRSDAEKAFCHAYPHAPDSMIQTAVHHVYGDGPEAVIRWLADAELFLRDPDRRLDQGSTFDLLHHVYNWHQFQAMLPLGKAGLLERLDEIIMFADEGSIDALKHTADDIKEMLNGNVDFPDFDEH